jgi:hypothetical protein
LLAVPRDVRQSIQESIWWERGWTYQEGVLSRRRLVFTDSQVYFECGGMVAYECFQLPPGNLHSPTMLNQERFIQAGLFSGTESSSSNLFRQTASANLGDRQERAMAHIRNYSHRKISYNCDVLSAVHGILASLQVYHIFGVVARSDPRFRNPSSFGEDSY